MKIIIERSGGLTGIVVSHEMEIKDLPQSMVNKNSGDTLTTTSPITENVIAKKEIADHFNYRVTFKDGTQNKVVECNQYDIKDNIKDVIRYVEAELERKINMN